MDEQHVVDQLDAYALGAVTGEEARAVEEHVAECVSCWEELGRAERAASLLALSVPMHQAPERLGERIMKEAERDTPGARRTRSLAGIFSGMHLSWPAATGIFGTAAAAVLVFAVSLQMQVDDLEDDNNKVQARFADSQAAIANVVRVSTADDVQEVSLVSPAPRSVDATPAATTAPTPEAPEGEYRWSRDEELGVIFCKNLPQLEDDEVYMAWYQTETQPVPAGTFESQDGNCFHVMQPVVVVISATGIGVSREQEGASPTKPTRWLIFGRLR